MSKFLKAAGAALIPLAATATIAASPANAYAPGCSVIVGAPSTNGISYQVAGSGRYQYCAGNNAKVELFRWVNGSPSPVANTGWLRINTNDGYSTAQGPLSYGCSTYYTKVSLSNGTVLRSSGKTLCK